MDSRSLKGTDSPGTFRVERVGCCGHTLSYLNPGVLSSMLEPRWHGASLVV